MNLFKNLKEQKLGVLIPVCSLSLVAFILILISIVMYSSNCASEFNGNQVSASVVGINTTATIMAGIALLGYVAAFFLAKNKKISYIFTFARIFNYVSFALALLGFLFEILDEYSLLGTILYPIVSGTVGDPVDPVLSTSFFVSLIFALVACICSLIAGILMRKKSYKVIAENSDVKVEA